jgi:hypothetical protein
MMQGAMVSRERRDVATALCKSRAEDRSARTDRQAATIVLLNRTTTSRCVCFGDAVDHDGKASVKSADKRGFGNTFGVSDAPANALVTHRAPRCNCRLQKYSAGRVRGHASLMRPA